MSDVQIPDEADVARLYLALGRLLRSLRRDVPDAPVGHGALSVLATLLRTGPMRLGSLAEIESVRAPSMTRIVDSLEAQGHVRRTPDARDGRAQLVELTDSGRDLVLLGRAQRMVALATRMDRLDPVDRRRLLDALPLLEELAEA